jgi:uncharacterized C2H2 Zn-finger protein
MPATSFACPECQAILRPTKPLPAGARIKCPKCTHVFTPDLAKSTNGAAIHDKSRKPSLPMALTDEDEGG